MCNIISVTKTSRLLLVLTGLLMVSACTQMPKHGNMLVFGVNTSVGVNVGKDASQTPTIQIGINRQEVALVPLSANTAVEEEGGDLIPCPLVMVYQNGQKPQNIEIKNLEDCKFSGTHDGKSRDSYSTLASFGTRASGDGSKGSIAVAQYFATGIAAQRLAETGGANVVLASSKAKEIAEAAKTANEARIAEAQKAFELTEIQKEALKGKEYYMKVGEDWILNQLGPPSKDLEDEGIKTVTDKIGSGYDLCTEKELKKLELKEVKDLIAALKEMDRTPCLGKLGKNVLKEK